MARWRLIEPHYLFTDPDTKWEYVETDRATGRQVRRVFILPRYFHHEAQSDWTEYPHGPQGEGIVAVTNDKKSAKPSDIIFKGDPTPGMYPLDDEAKEVSASFAERWGTADKFWDMNSEGSYASRLADNLVEQQNKVNMKMTEIAEKRDHNFDQFLESMTAMMQQNQQILMILAEKNAVKDLGITPVIDTEEPLPPPEKPKPEARFARRP